MTADTLAHLEKKFKVREWDGAGAALHRQKRALQFLRAACSRLSLGESGTGSVVHRTGRCAGATMLGKRVLASSWNAGVY